jgi:hypothetical protein
MSNALILVNLLLQNMTQLQQFAGTLQKAIAEGRDVTKVELLSAGASVEGRLGDLQAFINSMK